MTKASADYRQVSMPAQFGRSRRSYEVIGRCKQLVKLIQQYHGVSLVLVSNLACLRLRSCLCLGQTDEKLMVESELNKRKSSVDW